MPTCAAPPATYLGSELDKVGEVLQALSYHEQRALRVRRRRARYQTPRARLHEGWTDQA